MPGTTTAPAAQFKIHSNGAVKAYTRDVGGDTEYFLEGIASSNVRDRQGDTITAQGQAMMLEQAKGLTMFLNHEYDVPECVLGTCEDSRLETKGDIIDLAIVTRIAKSNPRAMKSWQLVKEDKVTLGFSIGGALTQYEVDEENDDGSSWCPPLIIDGINLFEISLCGVPANPRAYTRDFVSQIARGFMRSAARSPEVRDLVRKALCPTPSADEACAFKDGCAEKRADDSLLCKTHRDTVGKIEDVGAPPSGDSALGDAPVAKTAPDSAADVATSVSADDHPETPGSVTITLNAPPDFDADAFVKAWNDELAKGNAPSVTETERLIIALGVDTADAQAKIAELATQLSAIEADLTQKVSERDTIAAELAALTQKRDATKTEVDAFEKRLAELKATPTGRQTKTATSGGSSGPGATFNGIDLSTLTEEELRKLHQQIQRGEVGTDARSTAQ